MKILVAGLNLRLRATLQGGFHSAQFTVGNTAAEVLELLEEQSFAALVIDESVVEAPQSFFVDLDQAFLGTVVFLSRGRHSAEEIRDLVDRGPHSVILHHPLDRHELLRRLATQLGLPLAPLKQAVVLDEPGSDLMEVWEENRELLQGRLELIAQVSLQDPKSLLPPQLEEAWRAAFQLAGTLGSFGVEQGTVLAREAQDVIKPAKEGAELLDAARLQRLVGPLSQIISSHGQNTEAQQPGGTILLVSADPEFAQALQVEALLVNWSVAAVHETEKLFEELVESKTLAIALDLDCPWCEANPQLVQELLEDGMPCLVMSREPYEITAERPHLRGLTHPVSPYQALMTVLRSQAAPAADHPPSVLVLDDDPIVLMVVSATLSKADMHVCSLENPLEFWDRLAQEMPDVIILDIDLPPLGGIELCRALRNYPNYAGLPVIFISSYNDAETISKAFEAGADDFLYKPVSSRELLARVRNRLERTRQIAMHTFPLFWCEDSVSRFNLALLEAIRAKLPLAILSISAPRDNLARLLRLLRRALRPQDMVRRVGEDELVVGLPGLGKEAAEQRLSLIFEWEGEHTWTGAVEFPTDGADLESLIEAAQRQREAALPAITVTVLND